MTAFNQRLKQTAHDELDLAHQCQGRPLEPAEEKFTEALMSIYGEHHDFEKVAKELAARGIEAPRSGRTDWSVELLEAELVETNKLLDAAYQDAGYGS